jgi:hypothetical protein
LVCQALSEIILGRGSRGEKDANEVRIESSEIELGVIQNQYEPESQLTPGGCAPKIQIVRDDFEEPGGFIQGVCLLLGSLEER